MRRYVNLVVQVAIDCPSDYDYNEIDVASELILEGISLDGEHECRVIDYQICGLSE